MIKFQVVRDDISDTNLSQTQTRAIYVRYMN